MANGQPDLVSPEDVRHVEFTETRRGYDRDEVHVFLDRVIVTLEELGRRLRSARQASGTAPAPVATSTDVALHDPDGAAQRLLAAAQRTADQLVHEAGAQATTLSAEADQYAARVRRDADDYAAGVTGQADDHAELIRATAADEARRAAEELRAGLVDEIHDLEVVRDALANDRSLLETHLTAQRERLQQVLASLRVAVEDGVTGLELDEPPALSGASLADVDFVETAPSGDEPAFGDYDDDDDVDADATVQVRSVFEAEDGPGFLSTDAPTAPVAVYTDDLLEGLDDDAPFGDEDDDGVGVDAPDDGGGFATSLSRGFGDDDLAAAPRGGFFDDGLDDELDAPEQPIFGQGAEADDDDDFEPTAHERSIFDIEAERFDEPTLAVPVLDLDLDEDDGDDPLRAAPMTRPTGEGDGGFFDELRAPASDDLFGSVDDDTDAALAAFFDQDEDEEDERWRRRFGR